MGILGCRGLGLSVWGEFLSESSMWGTGPGGLVLRVSGVGDGALGVFGRAVLWLFVGFLLKGGCWTVLLGVCFGFWERGF